MTQNAFAASDAGSLGLGPESWMDDAACREVDPDMFFPPPGGDVSSVKRLCRTCPVRWQCLEFALRTNQRYGIWGGYASRHLPALRSRAS